MHVVCPGSDAVGKQVFFYHFPTASLYFPNLSQICFGVGFLEGSQQSLGGNHVNRKVWIFLVLSTSALFFLAVDLQGLKQKCLV